MNETFRATKKKTGVSIRVEHRTNSVAARVIFPAWFDYLEESFSYKEVLFKV